MVKTAQELMDLIQEKGIKMIDFKIVDINGQFRHVTIPAAQFSEDTLTSGIGFDASNYGYAVVEKSDMVFIPDITTAVIDPFCEVPTLSISGNKNIHSYQLHIYQDHNLGNKISLNKFKRIHLSKVYYVITQN